MTRDAVLDAFSEGTVTRYYNVPAMADEIVRLREALANYPETPERSTYVTDKVVEAACTWADAKRHEYELLGQRCCGAAHPLIHAVIAYRAAKMRRKTMPNPGSDEAIAAAVRGGRQVSTNEPEVIAELRSRVKKANELSAGYDNRGNHVLGSFLFSVLAAYDAIVAERDAAIAAVREAYREGWVTAAERGDLDEYGEYTHHQTLEPEDFLHSRTADVIRRVMP